MRLLSLSRSGNAAGSAVVVLPGAVSSKSRWTSTQSSPDLLGVGQWLILHLNKSTGRAASTLLDWLLVCRCVEPDEEEEVRAENSHTGECSKLLSCADSVGWEPWEVAGAEVGVRCKVDESEINHELDDLEHGDVLLPPNSDSTSRLEVVPVHDNVNHQVEGDGHPGDGGVAEELGVAKEGGGTVVVGVEEGERLLLEEEEAGVEEFEVLGEVVQLVRMSAFHRAFCCHVSASPSHFELT